MSGVEGEPGTAAPSTRGYVRPPSLGNRQPKRWPIWSEPTRCNICGFAGEHSSVCPLGPEPTKSRERR